MPTSIDSSAVNAGAATRTLEQMQQADRNTGTALDKDAFMQLLVEQMSHQDPLSPASDTEYIAQLAQFSMLEQMQSMNDTLLISQSYSLVGKEVMIATTDASGNPAAVTGRVDGVFRQAGIDYVVVGGNSYPLSSVAGMVYTEPAPMTVNVPPSLSGSTGLLGMLVSALSTAEDGTSTTISGRVASLIDRDGISYVVLDSGDEVAVDDITEISQS